jgi:hypothetical protein
VAVRSGVLSSVGTGHLASHLGSMHACMMRCRCHPPFPIPGTRQPLDDGELVAAVRFPIVTPTPAAAPRCYLCHQAAGQGPLQQVGSQVDPGEGGHVGQHRGSITSEVPNQVVGGQVQLLEASQPGGG